MQRTASLTQPSLPPSSLTHPQEDPITIAENRVVAMLDKLENIGALQRSNRMELEEFLNPPDEAHPFDIDTVTDKDIFDAVMEARREEEEGGDEGEEDEGRFDGDDVDTDALVEPTPTRAEALQAALTTLRYIKDKEGAYFRELESTLASFMEDAEQNRD